MKMDKEYLMKLVDGGIKDIEYEHDSIKVVQPVIMAVAILLI